MATSLNKTALLAAATLAILPLQATAQTTADDTDTITTNVEREDDDDDFPWGLLGLLGLAGLLGRKRNEADIHVDARRNTTRP